jgi:hypothetical protein
MAQEESSLLDQAQKLVELERSLTTAMEKAEPWLPGGKARPLPANMEEVLNVLNVARNLASRASAPAGWNPQAPVIGFTTPNPLPHQLRGGALGALQLEMARKSQQDEKKEQLERKREREEAKKKEESNQAKRPAPTKQQAPAASARPAQQQRPRLQVREVDMNLSDDSSSEEEESEEE